MEQSNNEEHEGFSFRLMTIEDIPNVMVIEHEAFTLPWSDTAFRNELMNNLFARYLVMENDGKPIGYAGMWTIVDEAHVTNIAILKAYRGRKLGERLLDELIETAANMGMIRMTLEVRVSNTIAQRLYEKKGFVSVGLRKGYYSDNHEDAMIMWADLPQYEEYGSREGSVEIDE
ncbi:ribosomal protein S18-alanine N-acetyltransferase [Paenibacillus macquariensis]|uniref:[SSU ribosomal protein S18P]-alanine acetyltransferase n=1 Tax=Paenibacillus macquariensis TaxID=948756 RepID=A0ABY1JQY0_9BACL|nr:ribosomal protein S18-alanine N-acetyltransferase [Paenibacillus macquariensis]MEC0092658.1 ribosomal protein S18-alanine N-acetyltransferase [Paenibacillus macquariensis]OAB36595.1 ribosomal-protein-alanine N-acetyltransferase RimI [Paenibacillus macquariensis subsp. macquariensis]SIQ63260.1 [SSU ribosomal protein S18P]-alanine acetyltransferase [Paenibacillus macquariensis]